MRLERVQVRVFIEGVLVSKANNITVQTFANETARASFSLPPIPGFETEELVRARVHIFWSDVETRAAHSDDDWPLLFEGEIVADSFGKTPQSRSQTFHCSGYHTYWEQVLLYYYDLNSSGISAPLWAKDLSVALGNETFTLDANVPGASSMQRLAFDVQNAFSDIKSSGSNYQSIVRTIFSGALDTNFFFRQSDSALALSSRFVTPKDENVDLLIDRSLLLEAIRKDVLTVSGESTMMSVLTNVLRLFRYQIVHNAQPVILDPREKRRRLVAEIETATERVLTAWREYLESLEPAESDSGVTSVGLNETQIDKYVSELEGAGTGDNTAFLRALAEDVALDLGYRDSADADPIISQVSTAAGVFAQSLSVASEPAADSDGALDRNQELGDLLSQFMILPDTRFALPPTCNVIFPGSQTSLSMSRDLLKQPTRGIATPFSEAGVEFRVFIAPDSISTAKVPARTVPPQSSSGFHRPVLAPHRISSGFGPRQIRQVVDLGNGRKRILHPHGPRAHKGIDIARPRGTSREAFIGTPVYAFDDGVVERAGAQDPNNIKRGYGLRVYINHANGMQTRYAHLNAIYVSTGDFVERGQIIGEIGNTGTSTGPHLHFEVRVNGKAVDPEPFINAISDDNGTSGRPLPDASGTNDAVEVEVPDETAAEGAQTQGEEETFADFKYLTPEEELKGIVPFFDRDVVRAHTFVAAGGNQGGSDEYMRQMLKTELFQRRYEMRSLDTLTMPLNPNVIAGFPALIVDPSRSIIGRVTSVTHTITVGGGGGAASTSVAIDAPRFWDEGDPYHWQGGEAETEPVKVGDVTRPLPKNLVGPTYYLTSLLGTNSTDNDEWWSSRTTNPRQKQRPVDDLYEQLFGPGVKGIPYQYATRTTNQRTTVAYNKAIDSRRETVNETNPFSAKPPNGNTIVGRYYSLVERDPVLADEFVRSFTRRRGVSERVLMSRVLGAETADGGFSYTAVAFRPLYQATVRRMIAIINEERVFRG